MNIQPIRIKTITAYHKLLKLPRPEHPLVSFIDIGLLHREPLMGPVSFIYDFYTISLKKNFNVKMKYGQQPHDFDEGVLHFMSPGQLLMLDFEQGVKYEPLGWVIVIHPDFLWNTDLAKKIKNYAFFDYAANEALYLSEKEEKMITDIGHNIEYEYHGNIDHFSQNIIISQLELLLNYAERFYQRQFITRKVSSHEILTRLETMLNTYFQSDNLAQKGLPTVAHIAESLNISPSYLNSLLKSLTGQSTQQHLHNKLIELAKEKLSTTNLTVSEIAFQLGFEHLQSFGKLFKNKTSLTPVQFRASFN